MQFYISARTLELENSLLTGAYCAASANNTLAMMNTTRSFRFEPKEILFCSVLSHLRETFFLHQELVIQQLVLC